MSTQAAGVDAAAAKSATGAEADVLAKWTRRARIFVALTIAFSLVMGVLALVAGILVGAFQLSVLATLPMTRPDHRLHAAIVLA
jgi:hypothetical protein